MDISPPFPRSKRNKILYFLHVCLDREYQRPSADGPGAETPKGMQRGLFGTKRCSLSSFSILGTGCTSCACGSLRRQAGEVYHPALLAASFLVTFGNIWEGDALCLSFPTAKQLCQHCSGALSLHVSQFHGCLELKLFSKSKVL